MAQDPQQPTPTRKETLVFFAKLVAYLVGLGVFGVVAFWVRRNMGH